MYGKSRIPTATSYARFWQSRVASSLLCLRLRTLQRLLSGFVKACCLLFITSLILWNKLSIYAPTLYLPIAIQAPIHLLGTCRSSIFHFSKPKCSVHFCSCNAANILSLASCYMHNPRFNIFKIKLLSVLYPIQLTWNAMHCNCQLAPPLGTDQTKLCPHLHHQKLCGTNTPSYVPLYWIFEHAEPARRPHRVPRPLSSPCLSHQLTPHGAGYYLPWTRLLDTGKLHNAVPSPCKTRAAITSYPFQYAQHNASPWYVTHTQPHTTPTHTQQTPTKSNQLSRLPLKTKHI